MLRILPFRERRVHDDTVKLSPEYPMKSLPVTSPWLQRLALCGSARPPRVRRPLPDTVGDVPIPAEGPERPCPA
ncbi:MAG: hypothetical protein ACLTTU_14290 [Bilophila wadsworthia]